MARMGGTAARGLALAAGLVILAAGGEAPAQVAGRPPPSGCAALAEGRVAQEVAGAVAEELRLPGGRVRPEAQIVRDLGADELGVIEVTMNIERRLGIDISEQQAARAATVGGFADLATALLRRACGR